MSATDTAMGTKRVMPSRPRAHSARQRPLKLTFESGSGIARLMFQFAGAVLVICSAGLWVLPDPQIDADAIVMKLVASLFFLFTGLALLMRNHDDTKPEVHFDSARRELCVTRRNTHGRMETVLRRPYDSFGAVYISTGEIELWNEDGTPFLALPVPEPAMLRELRNQFGPLCA